MVDSRGAELRPPLRDLLIDTPSNVLVYIILYYIHTCVCNCMHLYICFSGQQKLYNRLFRHPSSRRVFFYKMLSEDTSATDATPCVSLCTWQNMGSCVTNVPNVRTISCGLSKKEIARHQGIYESNFLTSIIVTPTHLPNLSIDPHCCETRLLG